MMTAEELRARILAAVSSNGGHLAASLGAVELARALACAFDPFVDRVLWDVGHQAYAWKLLTGRADRFDTLRRFGGLSGFPLPLESTADAFVAGHAGNALSAAQGLAAARSLAGGTFHVVAVVGDAALTNGESLEALASAAKGAKTIIVVNDNKSADRFPEARFNRGLVEALDLAYVGPVDGHDEGALAEAFAVAKAAAGSVVVHVRTVKGKGFAPAESAPEQWHGVGAFNLAAPLLPVDRTSWSAVFGDILCAAARKDARICALTAAMKDGTGLGAFAAAHPLRFFDVGIRESHLVTFAAGLAKGGRKPVVAVYSSFLQRAVDQVLHDVCLQNLGVIIAVDRAGCVGADGVTHQGLYDLAMLRGIPNLTIAQPKDARDLARMLDLALATGGPWVIRYPRGVPPAVAEDMPSTQAVGRALPLAGGAAHLQLWALGDYVVKAREVARLLAAEGLAAGVVDAQFVKPLDTDLLRRQIAEGTAIFVALENGVATGGFGGAVAEFVAAFPNVRVLRVGWPDVFVAHGTVAELESAHGLTAEQIAKRVRDFATGE
ncbi:MAG: 1-deoxy-D-xylulose-5-phosphate synthase [Kiritimatiellae bacterium]|nr:1-deoxy-D-xylulose-5-phosphate synthase [Kiritimatiellia bacterium]